MKHIIAAVAFVNKNVVQIALTAFVGLIFFTLGWGYRGHAVRERADEFMECLSMTSQWEDSMGRPVNGDWDICFGIFVDDPINNVPELRD